MSSNASRKMDTRNQNFRIINLASLLSLEDRISDGNTPEAVIRKNINYFDIDSCRIIHFAAAAVHVRLYALSV